MAIILNEEGKNIFLEFYSGIILIIAHYDLINFKFESLSEGFIFNFYI